MSLKNIFAFRLSNEIYAVDILRVQEIKAHDEFTPIPNSEPYLLGVMNLRGSVVPVFDLRKKFNFHESKEKNNVVIVLNVKTEDKDKIVGIMVDAVSDTHEIDTNEQKSVPTGGTSIDGSFIEGLYSINNEMVILLNIDKLCELK